MQKNIARLAITLLFVIGSLQGGCNADQYNKTNKSQFEAAIRELYKLNLSGSETILDIGSGDGRVSSYIAQECIPHGKLVGIDNSKEMVSFALIHNCNSHVSYQCIDALDYIVPHEYDAIVSFWTLHWIAEYAKVMNNIAQCLKPGARALLCHGVGIPILRTIADALLDTEKWQDYKKDAHLLTYPSLHQVAQAIEDAGLIIENLEVKKNGAWMPKDDVVKNWLSLPMFEFIPDALREEFCQDVLCAFIRECPLNEKGEVFRWTHVVVMVLKK